MLGLNEIIEKLEGKDSRYLNYIYVGKNYTLEDLIKDLRSILKAMNHE